MNKIALLVDSGMDVPKDIINLGGVFILPLSINYKDGSSYMDKIEITPEEIYERLDTEIPTTSLPNLAYMEETINKIKAEGYDAIIAMTISSGLSGTFNALRMMLDEHTDIKHDIIDTKSIGIGGGIQAAYVKELIDEGHSFEAITTIASNLPKKGRVFFSIPTLEYLKKGGRIGLVTSILGTALNLNPVISCNDDGIYYTVTKARGRKKSLTKMIELVRDAAPKNKDFRIAVAYGTSKDEAEVVYQTINESLPLASYAYFDEVSPVLGAHTGPDVIGMAILELT